MPSSSQAQVTPVLPAPTRTGLTAVDDFKKTAFGKKPARQRTLLLLRGLPGAGKSTAAAAILDQSPTAVSVEADSYFVIGDHYEFNPTELENAHNLAQSNARVALESGADPVIIANTFTQAWEMVAYVELASSLKYNVEVRDLYDGGATDAELGKRNIHGVPTDKIGQMRKRYEVGTKHGIATGEWKASDIEEFLQRHAQHMECGPYVGVGIEAGQVVEAAPLLIGILDTFTAAEIIEMSAARLTRNVGGRYARPARNGQIPNPFHVTLVSPSDWTAVKAQGADVHRRAETAFRKAARHAVAITGAGIGWSGGAPSATGPVCVYFTVGGPMVEETRKAREAFGITSEWTPHATLMFRSSDVHGIAKLANVPKVDSPGAGVGAGAAAARKDGGAVLAAQRAWEESVDFLRCTLHPGVAMRAGSGLIDAMAAKPKFGPDDMTYLKYPDLQTLLPRGLVFVQEGVGGIHVGVGASTARSSSALAISRPVRNVLRGVPKFTGTPGNDDDVQMSDVQAGRMVGQMLKTSIGYQVSKKENGRAGAFSIVRHVEGNVFDVCVGTKLRHAVVRWDANTNAVMSDASVTSPMIRSNLDAVVNSLSRAARSAVVLYLLGVDRDDADAAAANAALTTAKAKWDAKKDPSTAGGHGVMADYAAVLRRESLYPSATLNFEVNDALDQHIERIDDGTHEAIALNVVRRECVPDAVDAVARLGVPTPPTTAVLPMEGLAAALRALKAGRTEGHVVYFTNPKGQVGGLMKVKSVWYVMCRAIREFTANNIRNAAADIAAGRGGKVVLDAWKRLEDGIWSGNKFAFMQVELAELYPSCKRQILANAKAFAYFYAAHIANGEEVGLLRPLFPMVWEQFVAWQRSINPSYNDDIIAVAVAEVAAAGGAKRKGGASPKGAAEDGGWRADEVAVATQQLLAAFKSGSGWRASHDAALHAEVGDGAVGAIVPTDAALRGTEWRPARPAGQASATGAPPALAAKVVAHAKAFGLYEGTGGGQGGGGGRGGAGGGGRGGGGRGGSGGARGRGSGAGGRSAAAPSPAGSPSKAPVAAPLPVSPTPASPAAAPKAAGRSSGGAAAAAAPGAAAAAAAPGVGGTAATATTPPAASANAAAAEGAAGGRSRNRRRGGGRGGGRANETTA